MILSLEQYAIIAPPCALELSLLFIAEFSVNVELLIIILPGFRYIAPPWPDV